MTEKNIISRDKKSKAISDFIGDFFCVAGRIFVRGPAVKDVVGSFSGDYVKMQMIDDLPCGPSVVAQDIIAIRGKGLLYCTGNFSEARTNLAQKFRRAFIEFVDMLF
jgi:hypothetical protein